jgi:uncharacterized protein with HEPN domain
MPSSNPRARFEEILREIEYVESATAGMSIESFEADGTVRRTVERAYSILSEAAVKLAVEAETLAPGIAWRDIRGLGNRLRHEYGQVNIETLWDIRCNDLDPLRRACLLALEQLERGVPGTQGEAEGPSEA